MGEREVAARGIMAHAGDHHHHQQQQQQDCLDDISTAPHAPLEADAQILEQLVLFMELPCTRFCVPDAFLVTPALLRLLRCVTLVFQS